jgi:hypothetical protein
MAKKMLAATKSNEDRVARRPKREPAEVRISFNVSPVAKE